MPTFGKTECEKDEIRSIMYQHWALHIIRLSLRQILTRILHYNSIKKQRNDAFQREIEWWQIDRNFFYKKRSLKNLSWADFFCRG